MSPKHHIRLVGAKVGCAPLSVYRPKGMHLAANPNEPERKKHPYSPPNHAKESGARGIFGPIDGGLPVRFDWLAQPDPKPRARVRHKRRARVNPLTKIAEQLPVKLPVLTA